MGLSIQVYDQASPVLQRLASHLNPRDMGQVAGRAVQNRVREHLYDRNRTHRNQLGGKRTNFAAAAARSTTFRVVEDGAVVSINHVGFRQRLEGGTILPTRTRYLAIPVRAEAYGTTPRERKDLEFEIVPGIGPVLVKKRAVRQRKVKAGRSSIVTATWDGGEIMYRLVRRVTQRADRTWLPTELEMGDAARKSLGGYLQRLVDRQSGSR